MGFKTIRTSDLSGVDVADEQLVTVVVRTHPDISETKQFDAAADALSGWKAMTNLVSLELKRPDGRVTELTVTLDAFNKLVPAEVLAGASGTRGRRPGFRPNGA